MSTHTNGNGAPYGTDRKEGRLHVEQFPASEKIYVEGSRPDIRVPMRRVTLGDTPAPSGSGANAPVTLYDTSGPWTDPQIDVDVRRGLPPMRQGWIEERGDTELLDGVSSVYGNERLSDEKTAHLRFEHIRSPVVRLVIRR